ncbi:hypothetical protein SOVF_015710 [Spinacia oleracea]|nr:hypothetical protein SOVF_015710 [Spinacia oleracea]
MRGNSSEKVAGIAAIGSLLGAATVVTLIFILWRCQVQKKQGNKIQRKKTVSDDVGSSSEQSQQSLSAYQASVTFHSTR